jgi:nucleotidyltransferase-like protein
VIDATGHLRKLAQHLVEVYAARALPRAALLVGSAATGDADQYSDLDMLLYYEQVPSEEVLTKTARELRTERYRCTAWSDGSGAPDEHGCSERYLLDGIECQVAHESVGSFKREIRRLVVDLELSEELLKIMSGLFEGLPLYGEELVEQWRQSATLTDELQRALIEKRWKFFPWWYFQERLRARDTTVWRYDVLVQSVYGMVGVLAALNRLYFSTFEFKRASRFLSRLQVAPPNLAARLNALFEADEPASTADLERLVGEVGALVAARFPDIDLAVEWGGHQTPPGSREHAWNPDEREESP